MFKIDLNEDINTDELLVIPERIYYETKDDYCKIEFGEISLWNYKRTIGRSYKDEVNEVYKPVRFKFKMFKNRKTYK
jgi:hypothetical protein